MVYDFKRKPRIFFFFFLSIPLKSTLILGLKVSYFSQDVFTGKADCLVNK